MRQYDIEMLCKRDHWYAQVADVTKPIHDADGCGAFGRGPRDRVGYPNESQREAWSRCREPRPALRGGTLTGVSARHQEHADVASADGRRRQADDVAQYDAPPRDVEVEEPLAGCVLRARKKRSRIV